MPMLPIQKREGEQLQHGMPLEAPALGKIQVSVKNTFIDCFEDEIEQKPSAHQLGEHTCTAQILRRAGFSPPGVLAVDGLRHIDFKAKLVHFCPTYGDKTCSSQLDSETQTRTHASDETWSSLHTDIVYLETPCAGLQESTPTPHPQSQYLTFGIPDDVPECMDSPDQKPESPLMHDVLGGAPSLGSRFHGMLAQDRSKACDPCAWFWKEGGCMNETNCKRCHLCPDGEAKIRRKEKVKRKRAAEKQFLSSIREAGIQQQVLGLVQGTWLALSPPPPLPQPDNRFLAAR